jgi:methionine sulfoxide reductase heme-binding subunit
VPAYRPWEFTPFERHSPENFSVHMPSNAPRTKYRLLRHHLPLALGTGLALLAIYSYVRQESDDALFIWSMATAYVAMALLSATLLTGPINVLRSRRNPVSTDLRRDLGIWAAVVGLAHVVVGVQVHFRGRMWMYFVREVEETAELVLRTDLFGFANYTGLLATFVLLLLLALSNDFSLRHLKAARWKALQRWNYGLILMVVIHGAAYQVIEQRRVSYIVLLSFLVATTLLVQLAGFRQRRRRIERSPSGANRERAPLNA